MPKEFGYRYCMTMIDSMTRYLTVYPLRGCGAAEAAECVNDYIWQHGTPIEKISTDRGCHFIGSEFQQALKAYNIQHQLHVSWRPQSSALVERCHRTLKSMIFILAKERQLPWPKVLKRAVCAFNASPNATTKVSPWEACRGFPYLINTPSPGAPTGKGTFEYRQKICAAVSDVQKALRVANLEADYFFKNKQNTRHTRAPLKPGDRCCIYRPLAAGKEKHFDWVGDFVVLDSNDLVSRLRCTKTQKSDWYSNHQIKLLPPRPLHLTEPDSDDFITVVQESGGADRPKVLADSVQQNVSEVRPAAAPSPPVAVSQIAENAVPVAVSQKAASNVPVAVSQKAVPAVPVRSSGRKRQAPRSFTPRAPSSRKKKKTEVLNIGSTRGQTYASVVKVDPTGASNVRYIAPSTSLYGHEKVMIS